MKRERTIPFILSCLVALLAALNASANDSDRELSLADWARTESYYKDCHTIDDFIVKGDYKVECYTNYHHYNSDAVEKYYNSSKIKKWVEMAGFNLWHPGSGTSAYKDYAVVAKIMNGYDLVAGLELLPVISDDQDNNERVQKFLETSEKRIEILEQGGSTQNTEDITKEIKTIKEEMAQARKLFRSPGYLKVLDELRKLDPSWALILAPSGEAADESYTQELVGFYYRAKRVKPIINEHCQKFKKTSHGISYACYPKLTTAWLGKGVRSVFSRRPFMGSFQSGDFDFTLVTSHIVFNPPKLDNAMETILNPSFGLTHYDDLGAGANKSNYARLAEMKVILEIMNKLRSESKEKDVIFIGDTNLEADNELWPKLLESFPGGRLYNDKPTTLSVKKVLADGTETNGVASDYDHVILDQNETSECLKSNGKLSTRVGNFLKGSLRKYIDKTYLYRYKGTTIVNPDAEKKRDLVISAFEGNIKSLKTIRRNNIEQDISNVEEEVMKFDERIFQRQLDEDTFYAYFREVVSDHFPVYFSCKTKD